MKTTNLDPEHQLDVTRGRKSTLRAGSSGITLRDSTNSAFRITDILFPGATITYDEDGNAVVTFPSGGFTVPGTVTPDGSPATVSSGTSYRAFPGAAWLDDPTALQHGVGDRFLIVYRDGTDHLTAGKIVGKIATVTDAATWTYTLGSQFDIALSGGDLRCEDSVSVLDVGGGSFHAVIAFRRFTSSVNTLPAILICDDPVETMTDSSDWTVHEIALSGHTQDFVVGRVHKLQNGRYMVAFGHISGTTHTNGVAWVTDITDWSSPTFVNINASTAARDEINFEEMPNGTLFAHMRNDATFIHETSTSTDSGDTWSSPATLFSATGWPGFRRLTSGLGLTVYRSPFDPTADTAWRQTQSAVTDTGWGSATILDTTGTSCQYATILQLDNSHALVIYGVEMSSSDADIYSQVFTDTSTFGTAGLTIRDDGATLDTAANSINFVGEGVTATGTGVDKTVTIPGISALPAAGVVGEILISDTPAGTPLVFADLLQNEAEDDLLYADLIGV